MTDKTDYITKTFYKNGKQIGWPELFYKGEFRGLIIREKPHYGHNINNEFVERVASDCICKIDMPEKLVTPVIYSRYDTTGKWTGYALDKAQILVKTAHYALEDDACLGKNQKGLATVQQYTYSVRQSSLYKEKSIFGYANQFGHLIRVSSLAQHERD